MYIVKAFNIIFSTKESLYRSKNNLINDPWRKEWTSGVTLLYLPGLPRERDYLVWLAWRKGRLYTSQEGCVYKYTCFLSSRKARQSTFLGPGALLGCSLGFILTWRVQISNKFSTSKYPLKYYSKNIIMNADMVKGFKISLTN